MLTGPIARGTFRTTIVLGLRLLVQAGTLLLVARMLGPRQFGAFAGIAALAVVLGMFSTCGMHLVLLGEVSKDPARRADVLPYAIPTTLLCGSALLGVYLLLCALVLREADLGMVVLVTIGVAETVLQPLSMICSMEHLALGRIARSQLLLILPLALRLAAASAVFVSTPADPLVVYGYGYLAASLAALIVAAMTLPAPWPACRHWRLPVGAELRDASGYAALGATSISPTELDKTLATTLLPLAASGLYAAGARVIGAATLPVIAMLLSAFPRLFREAQDQARRPARLLHWILAAALGYSLVLAAALWLLAPLFPWIFGPKYQGIEHVIRWLTIAVPGMALRVAAGGVLVALAKPWMRAGFEVVGLLSLVITSVLLVPRVGAIGMPLALACAEWVMACLGWIMIPVARRSGGATTVRPVSRIR